ncbi:MAG: hypothetical protein A3I88_02595 [Candidatus Portnoybacteria bacterium RIFCSPLOWO2_12_FULL_39_9]|uniref:Glycosyltransferase 2-like domain-containing protein n=1 Tax=Candidatus Portnoybacteria bacterium RIFCSPHIGHO2_12_FULL_38_9 TaxID=1801997 RepID=A0A1G2FH22_9BACT|nr:MAG: hypothetical protein A3H00_00640 [Candidatus Portnoybacteria bacterium RBG_13_40_8]OGZ35752.1 MAG: hypothetical protein A2646_02945 [Candidatus Portnoybacteria bacterium RIFCSPHIGHO2_02_FULL_39_12]OGZ37127.1 MAG: hypothetical protein A3J64_01270 [Candidatus Portnoybacteria bacterium RIFCSPHIGHO2_12_FULL_38_9]OGZ39496.1 MAG: hypothetical protein A3F21_03285 [Candidatus Portnoybacteria bacterium RIFCSPLOWO2_01_FULL_38_39]OGZ39724.1 MAG: hypothetical protein A3I88_02595 [Candidatus Portnoy
MLKDEIIYRRAVSIVIPAYNEESRIGAVLNDLLAMIKSWNIECEIIVVDDGSKDKTAQIAGGFDVQLVQHKQNKGYGASLKTGIRQARYNIIGIADADGTYPVERVPELVRFIGEYDMAVGARVGKNVKMPLFRRPAKWLLNKYANYLVQEKIPDLNSGLRVFKKDVFEKFRSILPNGFSFTTTLTLALLSNDYQVRYIPIDYFERGGKSKIRPFRDTVNFFTLITKTSLYFNPLRVYMPIALSLLGFGAISFGYDIFVLQNITDRTMALFLWGVQLGVIGLLADMMSHRR